MSTIEQELKLIRQRLDALPRIQPPAGAFVQDFADATNVPAGAPTTWVVARTIELPAQRRAVVRYLAVDSNSPAAPAFIRFRILVNGAPGLNYQSPPVVFNDIAHPSEIWVDVDQQNTVSLELRNLDMTIGYLVLTRLIVWSWSVTSTFERGR